MTPGSNQALTVPELRGLLKLASETLPDRVVSLCIKHDQHFAVQAAVFRGYVLLTDGGGLADYLTRVGAPYKDETHMRAICGERNVELTE
ncbi:MAG TPA: hypothetical protein VGI24_04650, partial [Solirubrobacteraceae bacterium]